MNFLLHQFHDSAFSISFIYSNIWQDNPKFLQDPEHKVGLAGQKGCSLLQIYYFRRISKQKKESYQGIEEYFPTLF